MTQLVARTGHRLDWLKVQVTRLCNFSCSFCSQADWASRETIDLDALERSVLSRLDALRLLIVTGGEPLARFSILEQLVSLARSRGTEVGIFSNLSLLTRERAIALRQAGVSWFRTTLNGSRADVHERTYPANSYATTMAGIEAARLAGTPVKIRTTVCKANIHDLGDLISFANAIGVVEVDVRPYLPLGDCNTHNSFALDSRSLIWAAARILQLQDVWKGKVQLKLLPNWFDFLYRDIASGSLTACEQCHCGRKYLYIDAAGNYRSCAGHRAVLGSIFESNIEEIWDGSGQLQETRSYQQDLYCETCPRKAACHSSNCHLVNYEAHGRFDKVNPTCPSWNMEPESALVGFKKVRQIFAEALQAFEHEFKEQGSAKSRVIWLSAQ